MRQIDELPMPAGRLVPVPRLIEELKAKLNDDWGTEVPGLIIFHARDISGLPHYNCLNRA